MFWNSKTPQQKLKEEIANMYQSTVNLALKQSSETFMQVMHIKMALKTCNDTAKYNVPGLARKYNLSESVVWSTIADCHESAIEYFLK